MKQLKILDEDYIILEEASGLEVNELKSMPDYMFVLTWIRYIGSNDFDYYLDDYIEELHDQILHLEYENKNLANELLSLDYRHEEIQNIAMKGEIR